MRRLLAAFLACLCFAAVAGCSRHVQPPVGRWEGIYDADGTIIAARMEVTPKEQIFVSAPNAENMGGLSAEDRAAVRQKLADGLAAGWDSVPPHQMDFDGKTFRKPGGIAPQAEWDPTTQRMTLIVYLDKGDGIRIPLRAVKEFSPNPFAPG
ncbi:MAG TPA: hypothetical protein VGH02_07420 [Rhizomicrobium sp.]|jgi:hypothetical protein